MSKISLVPKKANATETKRSKLRDSLWPDAHSQVWDRHHETGFSTIPRTLTLIMRLIDELDRGGLNPSRVYMDLWCRVWDEGFIEVGDEDAFAYASGYSTVRR